MPRLPQGAPLERPARVGCLHQPSGVLQLLRHVIRQRRAPSLTGKQAPPVGKLILELVQDCSAACRHKADWKARRAGPQVPKVLQDAPPKPWVAEGPHLVALYFNGMVLGGDKVSTNVTAAVLGQVHVPIV